MGLTQAQFKATLSWILSESNPFGNNSTGPMSKNFNLSGVDLDTWDQIFAQQFVVFAKVTFTGDTHTNTTIDNVSSTTGLAAGQTITGTGIATGTKIVSIVSTTLTVSLATTATAAGVTIVAQNAPVGLAAVAVSGGSLTAATTYYYRVTATGIQGNSEIETIGSNEASALTTSSNKQITLTWTRLQGATGYKIYRGTSAGSENTLVATITSGSTVTYTNDGTESTSASSPPSTAPDGFIEFEIRSFDNLVGEAVVLTKMLSLFVLPSGDDSSCKFAPGTTNGLTAFFGGTGPYLVLPPTGQFAFSDGPEGTGWTVDGSHKTFRITNEGTAGLTAFVMAVGSTL